MHAAALTGEGTRGELAQHLHVLADRVVGDGGLLLLGQGHLLGLHDDVRVGELAELAQFLRGELRLRRAAPPQHVHVRDVAARERVEGVLRDVAGGELLHGLGEDARDVHGDVADADHRDARGGEDHLAGLRVGVAVVPRDELRGGEAALEVLAGNAEVAVARRAHGVHDGVVVAAQVVVGEVAAELHVPEEAHARVLQDLLVEARDALDLLVVGGDAVADEAVGRGEAVEDVHADGQVALLDERLGGVEAGRSAAHHGDAEGTVGGEDLGHGVDCT